MRPVATRQANQSFAYGPSWPGTTGYESNAMSIREHTFGIPLKGSLLLFADKSQPGSSFLQPAKYKTSAIMKPEKKE